MQTKSMPVILRVDGYRLLFYSNEGNPREPLHIHVLKAGAEAKIWLSPSVSVAENNGFKPNEIRAIITLVEANISILERAWHEYFGN